MVEATVAPGPAALLCAPGYLEDQQVVLALGRELARRGFVPHLIQNPAALRWGPGGVSLASDPAVRFGFVVRFYQAEWLARLPGRTGWRELFRPTGGVRVSNPLPAVISESKRLPLSFGAVDAGTLRALLPECREPRGVDAAEREEWVLKAAYANTGDAVHLGAELPPPVWRRRLRLARWHPSGWVVQRRFETLALKSVRGPVRPCVGIFVIGGRAAGAYVRLSTRQVTDAHALEAPLFILPEDQR